MVSEPPGYWHEHHCPNKAKWAVDFGGRTWFFCGTHVRRWRKSDGAKIEELDCRG
jgi:hypothetical protein